MATIEGLSGRYAGRKVPLGVGRIDIGRDPSNSISIPDDVLLSRRHATLFFNGDTCYCQDHGSTNGTYLDGIPISSLPTKVSSGSQVACGSQSFRIEYEGSISTEVRSMQRPPVVAPPIQRIVRQPPPTVISRHSKAAEWYGDGSECTVRGIPLRSPLVYVGSFLLITRGSGYLEEPSLICPDHSDRNRSYASGWYLENTSSPVPFSQLPFERQTSYLRWLSGGRRSDIQESLVLLFLCGLERRIAEQCTAEECATVTRELRELRKAYPHYDVLQHKASGLESITWAASPTGIRFDIPNPTPWEENDPAVQWALGCLAHHGEPFTSQHAIEWMSAQEQFYSQWVVGQRCWKEVFELFSLAVIEHFEEPFRLSPGKRKLSPYWEPANYTLRNRKVDLSVTVAEQNRKVVASLNGLAAKSCEALTPTAKWLGRFPDGPMAKRAYFLAPVAVFKGTQLVATMRSALDSRSDVGEVSLSALLADLDLGDEPLKREQDGFFESCAALGYIVEPDSRMGIVQGQKLSTVIVRRLSNGPPSQPSGKLRAALRTSIMAASIVSKSAQNSDLIAELVTGFYGLDSTDSLRVCLLLKWHLNNSIPISKAFSMEMESGFRSIASECLIATMQASPSPQGVKELLRILQFWGWSETSVFSRIGSVDAPSVIKRADGSTEFRIPKEDFLDSRKVTRGSASIELDMEKVKRRLAETIEASKVLDEVFADDEPELPTQIQLTSADEAEMLSVLGSFKEGKMETRELLDCVSPLGLSLAASIERLNDFSIENCGETLIDGSGPFMIDGYVLRELIHE